jgi:hypothetical protein
VTAYCLVIHKPQFRAFLYTAGLQRRNPKQGGFRIAGQPGARFSYEAT